MGRRASGGNMLPGCQSKDMRIPLPTLLPTSKICWQHFEVAREGNVATEETVALAWSQKDNQVLEVIFI